MHAKQVLLIGYVCKKVSIKCYLKNHIKKTYIIAKTVNFQINSECFNFSHKFYDFELKPARFAGVFV